MMNHVTHIRYQVRVKLVFLLFALVLFSVPRGWAQPTAIKVKSPAVLQEDQMEEVSISLLTASPGERVYELFGHTAIRYRSDAHDIDLVLNYGTFSFYADNFIYHFVKGDANYELGVIPFLWFLQEYKDRGSSVTEQMLNMDNGQKWRFTQLFLENYRPENRFYRYNYLRDNCTTRARDIIEEAIGDSVEYEPVYNHQSFRQIVHHHTDGEPWTEFGIDLCLGAEADEVLDAREQMFIPLNLENMMIQACVLSPDSGVVRLVSGTQTILEENEALRGEQEKPVLTPLILFWCICFLFLAIAWVEYKKKVIFWGVDVVALLFQGVVGLLVAYLFFFSFQPTVDSNWLVLVFNPLPLLWLPWNVFCTLRHKADIFHVVNLLVLGIFLAMLPVIPQVVNAAIYPLILTFCQRSCIHLLLRKENLQLARGLMFWK